jgi:hypothetical protein
MALALKNWKGLTRENLRAQALVQRFLQKEEIPNKI